MSELYCVCYSYSHNNTIHRGGPLSYEVAHAWVEHLIVRYPDMHHWVEKA
jgi:hypothetical protein